MFIDTILDALIDTAKIVPVLLLLYILISFFSHRSKKSFNLITKKGKRFGPLIGSALGSIPQCGFSAVMADLYSKRAITLGTLFAIFLATSDEAIPILISEPAFYKEMLLIIGIKILIGILFGYLIDLILPQKNQLQPAKVKPKNETKIDAIKTAGLDALLSSTLQSASGALTILSVPVSTINEETISMYRMAAQRLNQARWDIDTILSSLNLDDPDDC